MATIRFRELVKSSGKPEPKSLWVDPRRDRQFTRAVKQNRVLTIVPAAQAHQKEFGEIGFRQIPHANYFIFPRPLPSGGAKVIGINYDLIGEAIPKDAVSREELEKAARPARRARLEKRGPPEKTFNVRIRTVAVTESRVRIKARDKTAAKAKAGDLAKEERFDPAAATIKREIKFLE